MRMLFGAQNVEGGKRPGSPAACKVLPNPDPAGNVEPAWRCAWRFDAC
ncbi:hypothetical protein LNQ03_31235 [Klebsiella pneumoniae subsp. pneumoniae]|nr:hypothetical protein [Klebsiella pneumoniae subsp. pneumoniae]